MTYEELMQKAIEVSKNSYSPYSKFAVGACLETAGGKIYTGCNFENSSFGMTICAERNAIGSAIADGEKGDGKWLVQDQYPKAGTVVGTGTTVYLYRK